MTAGIGWDPGGAPRKAAALGGGRHAAARPLPCPLWQGRRHLDEALAAAGPAVGEAALHAVPMTGELADIFPSRAAGVETLSARLCAGLAPARVAIYGGRAGFL